MRQYLKYIVAVIGAVATVVIVVVYGIMTLISTGDLQTSGKHTVYVTSNDIHTGFLFQKDDVPELLNMLPLEEFKLKSFEGIEFSFGDTDFFEKAPTWDKFTFRIFFDALFIPDKGLVHVDLYEKFSGEDSSYKKIYLNDEQFNSLIAYIRGSFEMVNNRPILYKDLNYYGTDRFFKSTQNYHFFHTCNSWAGDGLRKIKVKTGVTTPHKWAVLMHL